MTGDIVSTLRITACIFLAFMGQILNVNEAKAGRIEAGTFTAHDTFPADGRDPVRVNFQQAFDVTPVVVAISDQRGGDTASIQITNVSTTGFDELILESDNFDGRHVSQGVHYIAIEPGRHVFPDGTAIEAGFTNTSATQFGTGVAGTASFTPVSFSKPLTATPSVITHLQTANSETRDVANQSSRPHITALSVSPTITGFQLALERSQANSGPIPSTETVGWIAFPAGQSGTIPAISGADVTWSSVNTSANIQGTQNGCFPQAFGQTSASRVAVAKKNTRNNPDGGWFRFCSLSSTTIGLRVEEDRDQDNERSLTAAQAEAASIIAFNRPFHGELTAEIDVTKISESFSSLEGANNFALPDGIFEYVIEINNSGNSRPNFDSVVTLDSLPAEVKLVIDDIGAAGSGPIEFIDGSIASDLVYSFGGLGDNTDSLEFSIDGSDFSYTPSDSGDGTDPNVTHIRVSLSGAMAPANGSLPSSLTLRFKTKIR